MTALVGAWLLAAVCPASAPLPGAPGQAQVARVPSAEAMSLNRDGKLLYRDGRFAEARAKYAAALLADPEFLSPALNLACAFARDEKFARAAHEACDLVRRSYVPWGREVVEAADLGILQIRPEGGVLSAVLAEAAGQWGREVSGGVLFVARTAPPVSLAGEGVLVLGMHQEIFAWKPATGRYLQVTADDGRVLAFAQSSDGNRIVYVRAGRLVRTPGAADALRGLSVRQLDIPGMTLGAGVDLPGDVRRLSLWFARPDDALVRLLTADGKTSDFRFSGRAIEPIPPGPGAPATAAVLTGTGTAAASWTAARPGCALSVRDERVVSGVPRIRVSTGKGRGFLLNAPHGAGLRGLPFAGVSPRAGLRGHAR